MYFKSYLAHNNNRWWEECQEQVRTVIVVILEAQEVMLITAITVVTTAARVTAVVIAKTLQSNQIVEILEITQEVVTNYSYNDNKRNDLLHFFFASWMIFIKILF